MAVKDRRVVELGVEPYFLEVGLIAVLGKSEIALFVLVEKDGACQGCIACERRCAAGKGCVVAPA